MRFSPILFLYRCVSTALGPLAPLLLEWRVARGKEDLERLRERYGFSHHPRQPGRLVWLHGASMGESGVALQIAEAMAARDAKLSFLISSGTRTSASLVARRAGPRMRHIYAPIDRPSAVKQFLSHWRPDLGVFVESEVWPNLILGAQATGVNLALVNARMSPKTLARWTRWAKAGEKLFGAFALALAADRRTAATLTRLRGAETPAIGNLKLAAAAPAFEPEARRDLLEEIGERPVWFAASTHAGEEAILIEAHAKLREAYPEALLILAPRHPARGGEISTLASTTPGSAPRRSLGRKIGAAPVYIADTLGEMGLFYATAPVAFIAGSLLATLKGHNPIEPAKLDAAIVTGPFVESFDDIFEALFAANAATRAKDAGEIATAVATLWRDETTRAAQVAAARDVVAQGGAALEETVTRLMALLPVQAKPKAADATA